MTGIALLLLACGSGGRPPPQREASAEVLGVSVAGAPGAYTFSVTLRSPDTGCERFADWWEVLTARGELLYRRILLHSHAGEQPFTRSGGPVPARPEQELLVRSHMNGSGYGPAAMRGSVRHGFQPASLPAGWAARVERSAPQPEGCLF